MTVAACGGPFRPSGRGVRVYCGFPVPTSCEVTSRSTHRPFGAYPGWTPPRGSSPDSQPSPCYRHRCRRRSRPTAKCRLASCHPGRPFTGKGSPVAYRCRTSWPVPASSTCAGGAAEPQALPGRRRAPGRSRPGRAGHPGITAFVSRVPHRERLGGELVHVRGRSWPGCSRGTPDAGPQVSRSVMGRLAHIAKNSQVPRTPLVRARTRAVMTLCRWRPKGRTQPCVDVHTHARPHQRRRSEVFYRRDSGGS